MQPSLLQSSVSHDPSEIILICWETFLIIIMMLKTVVLHNIFVKTWQKILWWIESSKEHHIFEVKMNNVQSLLVNLMHPCWIKVFICKKNLTDPKLLNGSVRETKGTNLSTVLVNFSIFMAGDHKLSQRTPHSTGDLWLVAGNRHIWLVVLCRRETKYYIFLIGSITSIALITIGQILTDLLGVSQVEIVEKALVAHLLVCGKHYDVPTEVKAARPHRRARLQQS